MRETLSKLLVFTLAYLTRVHRIEKGNFVTWDEAHFGKFSQKYLSRVFYFDVHPPLGKMLTALSGLINGQTEKFDFGSANDYPVTFDYVGMRRFHAFIASFTPLFGYLILRELKFSFKKALILTMLFIIENGVISISRLVLLDSHLLSFTSATIYVLTILFSRFHLAKPSKKWKDDYILLVLGICIGCVMSIKWIGCLTTLQVGLFIIFDLFFKLLSLDFLKFCKYFLKRAFYLILIPCSIYLGMFYLHFLIVNRSGPDDGFMSSEFQLSLRENLYKDLKKYVSYGNQVTIRTSNGYLHSHFHHYPDYEFDPKENNKLTLEDLKANIKIPLQVTTYSHADSNNNFYFQKLTSEGLDANFVCDGDEVALLHHETKGYIQQTLETGYISEGFKVIANRQEGLDPMAVWIVEIASDSVKKEHRLKAVSSKFYFKNKETGMYLCSSTKKYPSWGFEQGEVLCIKEKNSNCLFNLQENFFSTAEGNVLYTELKPSFIKRFLEHQKVMFTTNKSFVHDPDLEPEAIVSSPWEWFILRRGLRMSQWHEQYKFYMFMNPLIHYCTSIGILLSPFILYFKYVKKARKVNRKVLSLTTSAHRLADEPFFNQEKKTSESVGDQKVEFIDDNKNNIRNFFDEKSKAVIHKEIESLKNQENKDSDKMTKRFTIDTFFLFISFGGWIFHYIPFFLVGRVLYLHHYFPALFFATLNLCYLLRNRSLLTCSIFVSLCATVFVIYSPLTYGFLDFNSMKKLKLLKTWSFVDN